MGMREEVRYEVVPGDVQRMNFLYFFIKSSSDNGDGRIITIFGGGRVSALKTDTAAVVPQ